MIIHLLSVVKIIKYQRKTDAFEKINWLVIKSNAGINPGANLEQGRFLYMIYL